MQLIFISYGVLHQVINESVTASHLSCHILNKFLVLIPGPLLAASFSFLPILGGIKANAKNQGRLEAASLTCWVVLVINKDFKSIPFTKSSNNNSRISWLFEPTAWVCNQCCALIS